MLFLKFLNLYNQSAKRDFGLQFYNSQTIMFFNRLYNLIKSRKKVFYDWNKQSKTLIH